MTIACGLFGDMVSWLTRRFLWELPHAYTHRQEQDRSLTPSGFCHVLVCSDLIILGLSLSTHGMGRQEGSPQALLGLEPRPWRGGLLALDLGEEQRCLPGTARTALHWRREWTRMRTLLAEAYPPRLQPVSWRDTGRGEGPEVALYGPSLPRGVGPTGWMWGWRWLQQTARALPCVPCAFVCSYSWAK